MFLLEEKAHCPISVLLGPLCLPRASQPPQSLPGKPGKHHRGINGGVLILSLVSKVRSSLKCDDRRRAVP
eukprot:3592413-Amphidinium_carterae.1